MFRRVAKDLIAVGVGVLMAACAMADERAESPPNEAESRGGSETSLPSAEQIDQWIAELSDDAFAVRQAAADRLLEAGMSARGPLLAVADGPDPEARAAARRLVALIDRSEFHRRLEEFALDTDGSRGLTLPGWEQYRTRIGSDPAARALFVEMQRQEGPLLSAVFGESQDAPEQFWEERLLRLVQWPGAVGDQGTTPPLGSCAAVLFLSATGEVAVSDRGAMLVENLIQRPPIRESLAAAGGQDALRRLVSSWILHCQNKNEIILARRLALAATIDLKEVLPLALAVAGGDPKYASVPPSTRAIAVQLIGQFGGREHVRHLEPLLEDTTVCLMVQAQLPGRAAANVQVRDVALVAMLHLTGQRPADYGYVHARLQPQRIFQLQTLHRENDEQRVAAIAKWHAWRRSQKNLESNTEPREGDSKEERAE